MNANFIREEANEGSISPEIPTITVRAATLTGPSSLSKAIDHGFLDPNRPPAPPTRRPEVPSLGAEEALYDSPDEDDFGPEFTQKAREQSIADQSKIARQKKADASKTS